MCLSSYQAQKQLGFQKLDFLEKQAWSTMETDPAPVKVGVSLCHPNKGLVHVFFSPF